MGSTYIDHFNDVEAYRRFREGEAILPNRVPSGRYARRAFFTNVFVRSVLNPPGIHQNVLVDPRGYDRAYIPHNRSAGIGIRDLRNSLLAEYPRSTRFNGIRLDIGNSTAIDSNLCAAMESYWAGSFEGHFRPYADLPRATDAHATLADRSLPLHKYRSQFSPNPWLLSPHEYCFEEVENGCKLHCTLDDLIHSERLESVLFPSQHSNGLGDSSTGFVNGFTVQGFALRPESTPFTSDMYCETAYGEETTGLEYLSYDHVPGAWIPYTDPAISTDPQVCESRLPPHRPYAPAFSRPLQHRIRKGLKHQVQRFLRAASSLHKQRLQLKREQAMLRSKKQELEDRWRHLQYAQEQILRGQGKRRRHSYNEYGFNVFRIDNEWDSDDITYNEYRNNRTRRARANYSHHVRCDVEDELYDDDPSSDTFADHEEHINQYPELSLPILSHAAVDEAKARMQTYKSAWSAITSSTEVNSAQIPYPSPTLYPEDLLRPSPSYTYFLMLAPEHSSAHVRIQFHALTFYLNPFGLQPRLVPLPSERERGESGMEIPGPLEVIGLGDIKRGTLEQIKAMMDDEVVKWHEDKLRLRGFGSVLDNEGPMDSLLEEYPETLRDKRRRSDTHGQAYGAVSGKKIKGKDLVHGVWAAVELLRGLVRKEIKERKEETMT